MPSIRQLEQVFNEMSKIDSSGLEYPSYRKSASYDSLVDLFNRCIQDPPTPTFKEIRRGWLLGGQLNQVKMSFRWDGSINKGQPVFFDNNLEINKEGILAGSEVFGQDDLDILMQSPELVVSQVSGEFIKVREAKSKQSTPENRPVTKKYYHLSRFQRNMLSLYRNYEFSSHPVAILTPSVGELIVHGATLKQYKVCKVNEEEDTFTVSEHKDEERVKTKDIKRSEFVKGFEEAISAVEPGIERVLRIGDYVSVKRDKAIMAMFESGWKIIQPKDQTSHDHWRMLIPSWIGKIVKFVEYGNLAVVKFDEKNPGMINTDIHNVYFKVSISHLDNIKEDEALERFSLYGDYTYRKVTDMSRRRKEGNFDFFFNKKARKEERRKLEEQKQKEKEELEKINELAKKKTEEDYDRTSGPYDLNYLMNKIILFEDVEENWFKGRNGLVEKIDNELGRAEVKFYEGRKETSYYFRVSQGHMDKMTIISDKVVSDEGQTNQGV